LKFYFQVVDWVTAHNLNLCQPSTCRNWTNSSVPKGFGLNRFYCTLQSRWYRNVIQNPLCTCSFIETNYHDSERTSLFLHNNSANVPGKHSVPKGFGLDRFYCTLQSRWYRNVIQNPLLRYLCLFVHSGVQHILCCVFVFVLFRLVYPGLKNLFSLDRCLVYTGSSYIEI
jgi:hypothetical protein